MKALAESVLESPDNNVLPVQRDRRRTSSLGNGNVQRITDPANTHWERLHRRQLNFRCPGWSHIISGLERFSFQSHAGPVLLSFANVERSRLPRFQKEAAHLTQMPCASKGRGIRLRVVFVARDLLWIFGTH